MSALPGVTARLALAVSIALLALACNPVSEDPTAPSGPTQTTAGTVGGTITNPPPLEHGYLWVCKDTPAGTTGRFQIDAWIKFEDGSEHSVGTYINSGECKALFVSLPDPTLRVFENEVNGDPGWTLASITRTTDAGTDELSGNNIGTTFGNPVICMIDFTHGCVLIFHNARGNTPPPAKLAFIVQPADATVGLWFSPAVQVQIQDSAGRRVANANGAVTLALGTNPGGGVLGGTTTVNAINGVATFSGLSLDKAGIGYTLVASSGGLTSAPSATFTVATAAGGFAQIATGARHVCGLAITGAAYCWGYNDVFGVGGYVFFPVHVGGNLTFVQAGLGARHTCAVTAAGVPYCWGYNGEGQMGDGTSGNVRESPTLAAGGMTLVQVVAGEDFSCGLTPAGAAYCWGGNGGSLGDGTTTNRLFPTPVAGGLTFMALSARARHTCGVTPAGNAYCWGPNGSGQLGDGTLTTRTSPVLVTGGVTFTAVSAGSNSTCGLTAAGAAYCWGSNGSGQLGDGTTIDKSSPVLVAGGISFVAVSVGESHACGLTSTGAAYCWGQNGTPQTEAGKLGNGTRINSSSPVLVAGNITFATISAGGIVTCGTTAHGAGYCWGANHQGALGDGIGRSRSTPGPVLSPFHRGAAKLAFLVQPSDGTVGQALSPEVEVVVQDAFGVRVAAGSQVTLRLGTNPAGATLAGVTTVNVGAGISRFFELRLDQPGEYSLVASSLAGLTGAVSNVFSVSRPTATLVWQARRWK